MIALYFPLPHYIHHHHLRVGRCLSIIAKSAPSLLAKDRARAAPPTSGLTTTASFHPREEIVSQKRLQPNYLPVYQRNPEFVQHADPWSKPGLYRR